MKKKYYLESNIFSLITKKILQKNMDIFEVVIRGDLESLKKLVSGGVDVEIKDMYGYTPLIGASVDGHFKIMKYLIEECNANVEAKSNNEYTPLHSASANGHFEIVKYLIEECNTNVEVKNKDGNTPLIYASSYGHLEIVKYLIEECNANVEAKTNYDYTPLSWASKLGHFKIVKCLIENGANYDELLERLEKEGDNKRRDQLEKIILEVADSRVKFITSDKY